MPKRRQRMFSTPGEGDGMSTSIPGIYQVVEVVEVEAEDSEAVEENPSSFMIFFDNSDFFSLCLDRRTF